VIGASRLPRLGIALATLAVCLVASAPAGAATVFSDGFETGAFDAWKTVVKNADGTATVDSGNALTGTYAARLTATATSNSLAYARATLSSPQSDATLSADVRVTTEGASSGNVPLLRVYDASGAKLLSFYRQNLASGKLYVNHSGVFALTTGKLPMDTWGHIDLQVAPNGTGAGTIVAKLNGTTIYQTTTANIGTAGVGMFQLGNEVQKQTFGILVDNVLVVNPIADADPPETVIDSGPEGPVADMSATFGFSSPEPDAVFECRIDGGSWTSCSSPKAYDDLSDGSHAFDVRARDAAGNVDPTPASRVWTVNFGGACHTSAPLPSNNDPGELVIADNFENGLDKWKLTTQGDATINSQLDNYRRGRCAGRLHVTTKVWDSRAYMTKSLPTGTNEVWSDGWFNFETEGVNPTWNTPTMRFISNGKRVLDFSRQNQAKDAFIRYPNPAGGWTIFNFGKKLDLKRWYHVRIHAIANDNLSTVEAWLDDQLVFSTNTATLGVNKFDVQMIGAEHQNQEGDTAFDDIVVHAKVPPATDVITNDGFESGNFAQWTTVQTGADGTATVPTDNPKTGTYGAKLTATTTTGSVAYLRKSLVASRNDTTASADLRLVNDGPSNVTIPLITLNDAGGKRVASIYRMNVTGKLSVQDTGTAAYATGVVLPLDQWANIKLHAVATGPGTSTIEAWVNDNLIFRSTTANLAVNGAKTLQIGNTSAGRPYTLLADNMVVREGPQGPLWNPNKKLLIADHLNKRLLITDFSGKVVWKFDNPTGQSNYESGPIGVRWMPDNQILATFGTGEVGLIDVATKTWVWQTKGYNGDWFQSPYDAEILPDGNLAVALRFNQGGRVSVYNRDTGAEVFRHTLSNAHSVHFRPADQSQNSDNPTLLVGGWGAAREVEYLETGAGATSWERVTEFTHEAMVVEDNKVLTTEGYYMQKVDRTGTQNWKKYTPDEVRRVAVNPNVGGGYIDTLAESDRIEMRDQDGNVLREFAMLSDGSSLDYPYGIQVVDYTPPEPTP
jgi:hypothetical protein